MDFSKFTQNPIILKEETRQYAFDETKEAAGQVQLTFGDAKVIMNIHLDNIKYYSDGSYGYTLILAGTKDSKKTYRLLGTISVNAEGLGDASFKINADDFLAYTDVIVAAISAVNIRKALHPVLKGPLPLPESSQTVSATKPIKTFNSFYNKAILKKCTSIAVAGDRYLDVTPFSEDVTGAVWKKIKDCSLFPIISPDAQLPIHKYGHFLWGYNDTHYFIAVPGRYFPEEQPDRGDSGFVLWQPLFGMQNLKNSAKPTDEQRKNVYGYWIAAINRYTGDIEELLLIGS